MARRRPKQPPPQADEESSSSSSSSSSEVSDEEVSGTGSSSGEDDDAEDQGQRMMDEKEEDEDGSVDDGSASDDRMEEEAAELAAEPGKANDDDNDSDGEGESDIDDDDEENQGGAAAASSSIRPPPISRSWAALTSHSPCYTGGSVAFSHSPAAAAAAMTTTSRTTAAAAAMAMTGAAAEEERFVLAQRGGDVAVVEASTGLLLRTVRGGASFRGSPSEEGEEDDDDDDDDDDEMMDAEAITAFALSPNDVDMIAITRSHLVRRYSLVDTAAPADLEGGVEGEAAKRTPKTGDGAKDGGEEEKPTPPRRSVTSVAGPAKVAHTFGKSGHTLPVTKVAFHPSGIFFATGSVDGLVKIWDVRNGYATHALHPTSSDGGGGGGGRGRHAVTCLEWRATSTSLILAIGREDGSISIHDLLLNVHDSKRASLPVAVLRDHLGAVTCVAWCPEVGGASVPSGARKHGGGLFFSSGRDSVINTWLISEEEAKEAEAPKRKKKKASKVDDGRKRQLPSVAVSYRRIRTLPVYEQVEGMVLLSRRLRPASTTKDQQDALDKKDVVLATCGTKGVVRLWRATPGGGGGGGIQDILSEFSPLAAQADDDAFGEENGGYTSLHLMDLPSAADAPARAGPTLVAVDAEQNMSFLRIGWGGGDDGGDAGIVLATDRAIVGHNGEILDLSVIPKRGGSDDGDGDGAAERHTVAIATNSSQVRIFGLSGAGAGADDDNSARGRPALTPGGVLDGHAAIVLAVDASPCGRYLTTASKDRTARVWHIVSRRCVAVATGHTEAIGSVALSRKLGCYDVGGKAAENGAGSFVVTASRDRTLKVWPLPGSAALDRRAAGEKGEMPLNARLSARAHEKDINIVSVAPNDSLIATGSQDKTVKLWNSADLALHGTLKGHKRGVWDCQFSPHDRVVATASGDKTIKLWSIANCGCVRTFQGHMAGVLRVRFLETGLQLISSGSDGLIKLWTIRTNECESTMDGHDDKVWALDMSPCGTALFSGGADSKIAVWRDTTKERDDAARDAEEQNILMEQKLSNHLRHKQYGQALEIALELDKPNQVLRVLTEIVEKDAKNIRGVEPLQKHVVKWSPERLKQMLKYCREWNTRARNSHIAMMVVKAVVTTIPAAKLASSYEGVPEILAGIAPYAERHFDRLDRMVGDSYLLDFTLFSMGSLHGNNDEDYDAWAARSKYVLPPKEADGRIQIGGSLIVGGKKNTRDNGDSSDDDDVITIGDSDSEASSDGS